MRLREEIIKTTSLLVVCLLAPLALSSAHASAKTSFETKQEAFADGTKKDFTAMDASLNKILLYYADSEGPTFWSDPAVFENFDAYVDSFLSYDKRVDHFWPLAKNRFHLSRSASKLAISKARPRARVCRKGNEGLTRAREKSTAAFKAFARAKAAYSESVTRQEAIVEASIDIARLIEVPSNFTDGYEDDAVYQFGSQTIIIKPDTAAVPMDPALLEPVIEALYDYDNQVLYVAEAHFEMLFRAATKIARKSKRAC